MPWGWLPLFPHNSCSVGFCCANCTSRTCRRRTLPSTTQPHFRHSNCLEPAPPGCPVGFCNLHCTSDPLSQSGNGQGAVRRRTTPSSIVHSFWFGAVQLSSSLGARRSCARRVCDPRQLFGQARSPSFLCPGNSVSLDGNSSHQPALPLRRPCWKLGISVPLLNSFVSHSKDCGSPVFPLASPVCACWPGPHFHHASRSRLVIGGCLVPCQSHCVAPVCPDPQFQPTPQRQRVSSMDAFFTSLTQILFDVASLHSATTPPPHPQEATPVVERRLLPCPR